jgi:hypothetical protein
MMLVLLLLLLLLLLVMQKVATPILTGTMSVIKQDRNFNQFKTSQCRVC